MWWFRRTLRTDPSIRRDYGEGCAEKLPMPDAPTFLNALEGF